MVCLNNKKPVLIEKKADVALLGKNFFYGDGLFKQ